MKNLGYDTHNAIIIMGSLGIMAFISISLMFFFMIAIIPMQHYVGIRYRHFRKMLFFGQILRLTHGGYLEILIAGYLNLKKPLRTKSGESISIRFA
jgi:hypothetical protein